MKVVEIQEYGDPEGLSLRRRADPVPGPGEVVVGVEAIGVAGVDAVIRSGALSSFGFESGFVPGSEIAGTVTAVGSGVEHTWVGRRVWVNLGLGGGYVEQVSVPVDGVVVLPEGVSTAAAVTVGASGAVAHFGLAHAHFVRGETVLVRGAAGGIGVMAVQLASRAGASAVAVTTSSGDRGDRLRELGATHVLDRAGIGEDDAPAAYDVILDIVAGPAVTLFLDRLEPNGRLVLVGAVGGQPPAELTSELMARFQRSLTLSTFSAATVDAAELRAQARTTFAAVADGGITAVVHETLPLDQVVVAHRRMDAGEVFGRIVLTP